MRVRDAGGHHDGILARAFEFLEILKRINNLVIGSVSLGLSIVHCGPRCESKDLQ